MSSRPYAEKILVVDDTDFMVKVLEDIFAVEGFHVTTARSGEEALELYEQELPDLVTLDIVMPGMDGIAVLQKLKVMDPAVKIVMVSAVGLEAKVMEAFRVGARNYVLKPFERDKVLDAARKVLDEY